MLLFSPIITSYDLPSHECICTCLFLAYKYSACFGSQFSALPLLFSTGAIQVKMNTKDLFQSLGNAFSNSVSHGRSEEIKCINVTPVNWLFFSGIIQLFLIFSDKPWLIMIDLVLQFSQVSVPKKGWIL